MNKVYIGYDKREDIAYEVAKHSILSRSSNTEVIKLDIEDHRDKLTRIVEWRGNQMWCPISDAPVGTDFTFTRFLIPQLTSGWALFLDCDIVCKADISELFALADTKYAVMVVKHDYEPKEEIHMVDQIQTKYERKNWASVMLFNCDHVANQRLVDVVNYWPGRSLHGLKWLYDEEIGELPKEWNHLVNVNDDNDDAKILHFTLGGPWLNGWEPAKHDDVWIEESNLVLNPQ